MEQWKLIANFPDYAVSNLGRVRRLTAMGRYKAGSSCKGQIDSCGYHQVSLTFDGRRYFKLRHRLVAEAFIPNPQGLPEVDHKDRDKGNNSVDNLRWIATKSNKLRGENTVMAKLSEADVLHIRALLAEGFKQKTLAEMYGVDQSCISNIHRRRNWAHI